MARPRMNTRPVNAGRLTPQEALIIKNNQVGNGHIKNMQGTSRSLYHFLPLDGRQGFQFFKELNKTAFPFTNIDQNKLTAGETMSLQRAYFAIMNTDGQGNVTQINTPEAVGFDVVNAGLFNFVQGNQTILKDLFTGSWKSSFNKASKFQTQGVYHFDTLATLLENVEFSAILQVKGAVSLRDSYLGLVIEGVGSILNLKTNS